jgi:hypothetical protein
MGRILQAIPLLADGRARLTSVSVARVGVKPGRLFHTLYRIELETDAGMIETRAWAALLRADQPASQVYRKAMRVPQRDAPPWCQPSWSLERSTGVHDSPPLLLQLFPWDYRLPTLPLALDPERVRASLDHTRLQSCATAGYWPGVRCQICYQQQDGERVIYGKVFSHGAGEAAGRSLAAIAQRLRDAGADTLTIPRVYGYLPALDLLMTGPVEGDPLPDLLHGGAGGGILARVATALALFHSLSVPEVERRFRPADDLAVVQPWVALVGAVFPSLARALATARAALERGFPDGENTCPVLVHRDFYDKQVVVGSSRIGMLDLDTVCLGDGEIDVANFCAHLLLRAIKKEGSPFERTLAVRQEFLEAYRQLRPTTEMRLVTWYLASALLRLGCVYAMRPWRHALAPRLIEASRRALEA